MKNIKYAVKGLSFIAHNKEEFLDLVRKNTECLVPVTVKVYSALVEDRQIIIETMKTYERVKAELTSLYSQWSDSETAKTFAAIGKAVFDETTDERTTDFGRRMEDFVLDRVSKNPPPPKKTENVVEFTLTERESAILSNCLLSIERRRLNCSNASKKTQSVIVMRQLMELEKTLASLEAGFICRTGGDELLTYVGSVAEQLTAIDNLLDSLEI